ncbi:DUF6036 family nucleotidyltransferase [Aeromonas caviae]
MKNVDQYIEDFIVRSLDKIDATLQGSYNGPPIEMYIAGGVAVNYYIGSRYTMDVDAVYSHRILLDFESLVQTSEDGTLLYFDSNYNDTFSLMHENYQEDAILWEGINNKNRLIIAKVLAPVDLAISKISRNGDQDREDILSLAREGLFTAGELEARALEALEYFVGNIERDRHTIELICNQIRDEIEDRYRPIL